MIATNTTGTNRAFNSALARYQGTFTAPQVGLYSDHANVIPLRPKIQTNTPAVFKKHEIKWKKDTEYISSLSEKYLHDSYARIIGLGWPAVPLILASLAREPDDWFYALRAITGADPVRAAYAGNLPKMATAWINWGRKHGLV